MKFMRKGTPPKPNVRQPPAWSFASQQLLAQAAYAAKSSIWDEQIPKDLGPSFARLSAECRIEKKIKGDFALRCEYYARVLHLLASARLTGEHAEEELRRAGGLPKARAEARLSCWLNNFAYSNVGDL